MNHELGNSSSRGLLIQWLLETPEAHCARSSVPTPESIQRLLADDQKLQERLNATGVAASEAARELYRNEWLRATLTEASRGVIPPDKSELFHFYRAHPERWLTPERRKLSHILITVQDGYPENSEEGAAERIRNAASAIKSGAAFEEVARRVSECPTALEGGALGSLPQGKLFPELDTVAFSLPVNAVSEPIRSKLGWHLIWCMEVVPPGYQSFEDIEEKLSSALLKRRQVAVQRQWVAEVSERRRYAG